MNHRRRLIAGGQLLTSTPMLTLFCFLALTPLIADASWGFGPEIAETTGNLTVPMGRDAVLTCSVTHLGGHKVGWVQADTKAIQAIHTTVVTHNPRVAVEHIGANVWKLKIRNVRKEDAGAYMCQINTDPMKSQVSYLDVSEPPDIVDDFTSSGERVRENSPLKLVCKARGNPPPKITWKREDGRDLNINNRDEFKGAASGRNRSQPHQAGPTLSYEGEVLRITQVSKKHMGVYFCIASNGVPPSVSKRVAVTVLFAPAVTVANQIVAVPLGTNITLECIVESSPKSINVWYKDDYDNRTIQNMIVNSRKFLVEEHVETAYRVRMTLSILNFRTADSGRYQCQATNEWGQSNGTIRLYDIPGVKWTTPSTAMPFRVNDIFAATKPTLHHRELPTTPHKEVKHPPAQDMQLLPDSSNQEMRTLHTTERPFYHQNNRDISQITSHSVRFSYSFISLVAASLLIILTTT